MNPTIEMFLVPRVNTVQGLTQKHIQKWRWKVDENEWVNWPDYQWRIWRNVPEVKWVNKVHEKLSGFNHYATLPMSESFALYHPKNIKRQESRLFVTFRPGEDVKDEVSITSGHTYKSSTVTAKSGKSSFSFFSQENFAWLLDDQEEKNFIKLMKRATNLIVKARTIKGAETTDHYSMMGFTKAYNTAKKTCG